MKVVLTKLLGGSLVAHDDKTAIRMDKLKTGGHYTCEIKELQDKVLHNRLMAMIRFGFQYWISQHSDIQSTTEQFETYRKDLTVNAGYYTQNFARDGQTFIIEAKSINWNKMLPEQRRDFYKAINRLFWSAEFGNCQDQSILFKLKEFDFAE